MLAPVALGIATLSLVGSASAKSCPSGYYNHSDKLGCFPCGPHAATCHSTTLAITCKSGYRVSKGFCVPKPKVAKPKPVTCKPEFYKHSKGKGCYPCGPHALTCHSTTLALTCESGYVEKGGFCVEQDTSCDAYWYWHSQSLGCFKCGDHAITCHSKGLALTCDPGYTVQEGYCLPPPVTVTVTPSAQVFTVTGGFTPRVTSTVTAIATAAPETVTATTSAVETDAGAQVTTTSTSTVTVSATVHLPSTYSTTIFTSYHTPTTTSTSTTSVSTSTSAPSATNVAKIAAYAGCVQSTELAVASGATEALSLIVSPFTASTALSQCLYYLAMEESTVGDYTHCAIRNSDVKLVYLNTADGTYNNPAPQPSRRARVRRDRNLDLAQVEERGFTEPDPVAFSSDDNCDLQCPDNVDLISQFGEEICGGGVSGGGYWSVWEIPAGLKNPTYT